MRESKTQESPREVSAKFAFIALLCSSPILIPFAYFGRIEQGLGASGCFVMVILALRYRWDLRGYVWFWLAIVVILLIQIPVVVLTPWGALAGRSIYPIAIADGALSCGCLKLAEMLIRRGERNSL